MMRFQVWAPNAKQVEVEVEGSRYQMRAGARGWWFAELDLAGANVDYAFALDGGDALPDPRSPWQPYGIHRPSRTLDHRAFTWTDQGWQAGPLSAAVIYELHIGTFTREGTFTAAIDKLEHLVQLGITHVELMPVAEFPGSRGWGYDGVDLYAPHHAYGGPDGLKRLVDACHARGLAVILDVVYNHLGPAGNYLGRFGPYFTDRYKTPWGQAINFDGPDSDEVRRFFCDNALMWLRDYHFDALRIDAVHAIVDTSATHFLEQLASEARDLEAQTGRHLTLIAESDLNDPRIVRRQEVGGYGIHAQWSDDFHHALHAVLTGERDGYYADFGSLQHLAKALQRVFVYDGRYSRFRRRAHGKPPTGLSAHSFLGYLQNHDQIGNRAKGERSSHLLNLGRLKIAAGVVLTAPFLPMLFQGEEWGASSPFLYFTDHEDPELGRLVTEGRRREFAAFTAHAEDVPDPQAPETFQRSKLIWAEREKEPHAGLLAWHRRLISLRKEHAALMDGRLERVGVSFDEDAKWIVVRRSEVAVASNLAGARQRVPTGISADAHILLASEDEIGVGGDGIELPPHSVAILISPDKVASEQESESMSKPDDFIVKRYQDVLGNWRETSAETYAALRAAMGEPPPEADAAVLVVRRGERQSLRAPAEIILEDGAIRRVQTALPGDLPLGYHSLRYLDDGRESRLIVSPGVCYLPDHLRIWGWSAQLYALRSSHSWGIGDLADLRQLGRWSAQEFNARLLLVNPLQAATPILPQQPSPYFPSTRRYRNLLYLRIEEVPGAAEAHADLQRFVAAGTALTSQRCIDRDAVFKLKKDALELLWARFSGSDGFERYCRDQGEPLAEFAVFCALAEHHGSGWHQWLSEYRKPNSSAVARFAKERQHRVRFYQWIQWLLDEQLARASAEIPLMQDLPIGVDPDGADAWAWQDILADGVTVGSPPDEFNVKGQDWGLPPFIPWKLRAAAYEPIIQTIRGALRHAGGLRIDHVMGLFRLFWIPQGADPAAGAYVRYPSKDLLGIIALESQRARAHIVGEDLGTVEASVRRELAKRRVLSYRVLWFEDDPPAKYPELALAAVTTHDLPTIAGVWTGADLRAQRELGLEPNEEGMLKMRERLREMTGVADDAPVEEVIIRAYELLAQAPSRIVAATLEDALAVRERPNMPGVTEGSWSTALPESLENLQSHPLARAIAQRLRDR
jgi:maltooligosyltrehalose trehalohydrolase